MTKVENGSWGWAAQTSQETSEEPLCEVLNRRLRRQVACCQMCHERKELQDVRLEDGQVGKACCTILSEIIAERGSCPGAKMSKGPLDLQELYGPISQRPSQLPKNQA